jgi:transaldolase
MNQLQQLESLGTIVVADTGDLKLIKEIKPQDATTNPSLILKTIKNSTLKSINQIAVDLGTEISKIIPGYISTEVDPSKSFDILATINEAHKIIQLYRDNNVDTDRILIKIAATWQGIKAAEILEKQGIKCNMTLIFSLVQAKACAEAGITLISPFIGRITDWYKDNQIEFSQDPGVNKVVEIYDYLKKYNYSTIIMGASFRNIEQITSLAGCDRLTISPKLIDELKKSNQLIKSKIISKTNKYKKPEPITQSQFYLEMSADIMATEKLNEGIHKFIQDINKINNL